MDQDRLAERWLWQPAASEPDLAARQRPAPGGRRLLDRAEAAARRAGELAIDWFWLRNALLRDRAERLSRAAERGALAAHRAGLLWPPRRCPGAAEPAGRPGRAALRPPPRSAVADSRCIRC